MYMEQSNTKNGLGLNGGGEGLGWQPGQKITIGLIEVLFVQRQYWWGCWEVLNGKINITGYLCSGDIRERKKNIQCICSANDRSASLGSIKEWPKPKSMPTALMSSWQVVCGQHRGNEGQSLSWHRGCMILEFCDRVCQSEEHVACSVNERYR